jgi:hypothetical protein
MTLHRTRLGAGILVVIIVAGITSALAGPSMSTRWDSMTKSQDDCLDAAKQAVRGAGFTKNFEALKTTVYGERGEYTAAVRFGEGNRVLRGRGARRRDREQIQRRYRGPLLSEWKRRRHRAGMAPRQRDGYLVPRGHARHGFNRPTPAARLGAGGMAD